jgi:hypothetical protein
MVVMFHGVAQISFFPSLFLSLSLLLAHRQEET